MKHRDQLTPEQVEQLVHKAGGAPTVAQKLGVSLSEVVDWHLAGLAEPSVAHRLVLLAFGTNRPPGRPRRSEWMATSEIRAAVGRLGGVTKAAASLGLTVRTLQRYLRGDSRPTRHVAETLLGVERSASREKASTSRASPQSLVRGAPCSLVPPRLGKPLLG